MRPISLKAARVNANLTQPEVANRMNVCVNTVLDWEKYRKKPDVAQAQQLCDLYECSIEDIVWDFSFA